MKRVAALALCCLSIHGLGGCPASAPGTSPGGDESDAKPAPPTLASSLAQIVASDSPDASLAAQFVALLDQTYDQATSEAAGTEAVDQALAGSIRTEAELLRFVKFGAVLKPHLEAARSKRSLQNKEAGSPACALRVIYVNGIDTPATDFHKQLKALREIVTSAVPGGDVIPVYNPSATDPNSLTGKYVCPLISANYFPRFYAAANTICREKGGWVVDLLQAGEQTLNGWASFTGKSNAAELRSRIREQISQGHKVVVIAHSQGNFFAEQAIIDGGFSQDDLRALATIHVGSPKTQAAGAPSINDSWVEHCTDAVAAFGGPPGGAPFACLTTAALPDLPKIPNLSLGAHSLLDAYLKPGSEARSLIASELRRLSRDLFNKGCENITATPASDCGATAPKRPVTLEGRFGGTSGRLPDDAPLTATVEIRQGSQIVSTIVRIAARSDLTWQTSAVLDPGNYTATAKLVYNQPIGDVLETDFAVSTCGSSSPPPPPPPPPPPGSGDDCECLLPDSTVDLEVVRTGRGVTIRVTNYSSESVSVFWMWKVTRTGPSTLRAGGVDGVPPGYSEHDHHYWNSYDELPSVYNVLKYPYSEYCRNLTPSNAGACWHYPPSPTQDNHR